MNPINGKGKIGKLVTNQLSHSELGHHFVCFGLDGCNGVTCLVLECFGYLRWTSGE